MTTKRKTTKTTAAPRASEPEATEQALDTLPPGGPVTDDGGRVVTDAGGRVLNLDTPDPETLEHADA